MLAPPCSAACAAVMLRAQKLTPAAVGQLCCSPRRGVLSQEICVPPKVPTTACPGEEFVPWVPPASPASPGLLCALTRAVCPLAVRAGGRCGAGLGGRDHAEADGPGSHPPGAGPDDGPAAGAEGPCALAAGAGGLGWGGVGFTLEKLLGFVWLSPGRWGRCSARRW